MSRSVDVTLPGTCFVTRQSVENVASIRKAKAAIKKAFTASMEGKGLRISGQIFHTLTDSFSHIFDSLANIFTQIIDHTAVVGVIIHPIVTGCIIVGCIIIRCVIIAGIVVNHVVVIINTSLSRLGCT